MFCRVEVHFFSKSFFFTEFVLLFWEGGEPNPSLSVCKLKIIVRVKSEERNLTPVFAFLHI